MLACLCCKLCAEDVSPGVTVPNAFDNLATDQEFEQIKNGNGEELRRLLAVPEGNPQTVFGNWCFPTSILVDAISYVVSTQAVSANVTIFKLREAESEVPVFADGILYTMENEMTARSRVFADMAWGGLLPRFYVSRYQVMWPVTNFMWVASRTPSSENTEYFSCRNVSVKINAATNGLKVATSLINAAVPDDERIVLPQSAP